MKVGSVPFVCSGATLVAILAAAALVANTGGHIGASASSSSSLTQIGDAGDGVAGEGGEGGGRVRMRVRVPAMDDKPDVPMADKELTITGEPCLWRAAEEQARQRRDAHAGSEIFSVCGAPSDHLHWRHVKVDPEAPQKGNNVTIEAHAVLDEVVSSGYVHVEVRLQCTQILHRVLDLCQIDPDHPCPIPHGKIVLKRTFVVPEEAPKGHYQGTIRAMDQNENQITCVAFDVTL